ncbi:MAG: hypothetical protein ACLT98_11445 [Eggerthellaceae bacterium]
MCDHASRPRDVRRPLYRKRIAVVEPAVGPSAAYIWRGSGIGSMSTSARKGENCFAAEFELSFPERISSTSALIEQAGVEIHCGVEVGMDISLRAQEQFDAVHVAIGAR